LHFDDRSRRVRTLKSDGEKVVGYFCCYVPLELLTAQRIIPYRIWGSMQDTISKANQHFATTACPYARSCFDHALKGSYDFLDGVIGPKTCDTFEKMFQVWRYELKPSFSHVIHVPNAVHPSSYAFLRSELIYFKNSLESFTGRRLSDNDLKDAISLHNENRSLMRQLYEFRKETPPRITGAEIARILIEAMSLPVQESNLMLERKIEELKSRTRHGTIKPRLLIWGTPVDDVSFIELIEDCGADVVMDDTCIGSRYFWHDVAETDDPLDGIVERYIDKTICPLKFWDVNDHKQDLEKRYSYLRQYVADFNVEGVIMQMVTYCAIHALDVPDLKDYFNEMGLPVSILEHDYSVATFPSLRTRIQAFVEMLE